MKLLQKTLSSFVLVALFGCSSVSTTSSKTSDSNSTECPETPEEKLDLTSIESINIQEQAVTKSNSVKSGKYVGYKFDAKTGQKLSYTTDKDLCIWIYTPENNLLQGVEIPKDGNYIVQVSAVRGTTTFDLKMSLNDPNSSSDSAVPSESLPSARSQESSQSSSNSIATQGWYSYSPSDRSYQVRFPAEPQTQDETQVILDKGAKAYLVRKDDIPIPEGAEVDVNAILDGARGGLSASGEIKSETKLKKNGISGRELLVTGEDGKILKARVFFDPDNGRLYQAIVGAVDGELPQESDAFLESLEIVK